MEHRLPLRMIRQPSVTSCGPTCLHAVYEYHGRPVPLEQLVQDVKALQHGGTLAVLLGCDALRRGFSSRICTFNVQVFDPTWFDKSGDVRSDIDLPAKLQEQSERKNSRRLRGATRAYIEFLALGGEIVMQDLNADLIRRWLKREVPLLTGLSSTWLYREVREVSETSVPDDTAGEPAGHFVVLCGYDPATKCVLVADPWTPNPLSADHRYPVDTDRLVCAIMLGIVTYDANLLIIRPEGQ